MINEYALSIITVATHPTTNILFFFIFILLISSFIGAFWYRQNVNNVLY